MSKRFEVQSGTDSRAVELGADGQVTLAGTDHALTVRPVRTTADYAEFEVRDGMRRKRVFVAGPANAREVFVDGQVFRFEVTSADERKRKAAAGHADTMTAPMPGTVIKLLVTPGQQVRRGDTVLKLEAMKMELPIRAPHDGTVKEIFCQEGELVQGGVRLLDLE